MASGCTASDPRSGFCSGNYVFYSKRKPLSLPSDEYVDVATFISSRPHSGNVALIDASTGRRIASSGLWQAVDSVASSLARLGIRKRHVVLLLSPNSVYFPIVFLAVTSVGAILTTANPLNTAGEISKQVGDSKPVLAFTTLPLVPKLSGLDLNIVLIGETSDVIKNPRIIASLEEMMEETPRRDAAKERIRQDDAAAILYSSGTTGTSKGVIVTHRNLIAAVETVVNRFRPEDGAQTFICTVPMFHVYGLAVFAAGLIATGATVVVVAKFDMEEMLAAIERYSVTFLPLVPPILVAMTNQADAIRAKFELRSLRWVLCGGAPLSKEMIEGFISKYPNVVILQGFGLTETTGIGAATASLEESRRYGAAGMLSPSTEAKIVDPVTGRSLGVNQNGELWLRGPTVMKGYFGYPEATASTIDSDGWLRTGDLCYIDEDGYLFVVDRLKELIKYKGYQVAPTELEVVLLTHPSIEDAAVIPFPDKEAGQVPMAYVVRKGTSNLSEKDVIQYVAKQVAPYKRIRRVSFVKIIPKNPSGKILRKDLINLVRANV